ncbi:hypothetical protein CDAR_598501 [Caerostris darwini]|uniref:Uncharacterized protein n=1 Tax=Caerostris darwini TaxID=1538125 RepID=A0AAV4W206_9ARAC|nr:hypothetical protein CDAR_598501 [Caerostris darwini]
MNIRRICTQVLLFLNRKSDVVSLANLNEKISILTLDNTDRRRQKKRRQPAPWWQKAKERAARIDRTSVTAFLVLIMALSEGSVEVLNVPFRWQSDLNLINTR